VFRPLELTAPGHAASAVAAAERDETNASLKAPPAEARGRSPHVKGLLILGAVAALSVAYALGAAIHRPKARTSADAPARKAALRADNRQSRVPVVAQPAPAPPALVGCTVDYASVTVDKTGRVIAVDPDRLYLRCPGQPHAHMSIALRRSAVVALKAWRFTPARFGDQPVYTTTPLTVRFSR
jgi:hypothetical protein